MDAESVARTLTLTVARRLDSERRGELVKYLADARLISGGSPDPDMHFGRHGWARPIVSLAGADLRGAGLSGTRLVRISLIGADLRGARFDRGVLSAVDLFQARLDRASFIASVLAGVDCGSARLDGARFDGASFLRLPPPDATGSLLPRTRFDRACLTGASFLNARLDAVAFASPTFPIGAVGRRIDFTGARLNPAILQPAYLIETKLPRA